MYIFMYMYNDIYIHTYICIHIYTYTCTYIYTFNASSAESLHVCKSEVDVARCSSATSQATDPVPDLPHPRIESTQVKSYSTCFRNAKTRDLPVDDRWDARVSPHYSQSKLPVDRHTNISNTTTEVSNFSCSTLHDMTCASSWAAPQNSHHSQRSSGLKIIMKI